MATLVTQSVVPFGAAIGYVLGANIGSGLIAMTLTREQPAEGRRIPLANLIFRLLMASLVLLYLTFQAFPQPAVASDAAVWVIYSHMIFNAVLLIVCLPLAGIMEKITKWLIPDIALINDNSATFREPNTCLLYTSDAADE